MNHYPMHLETVLDNCVTAVREQGQSIDACLERHSDHRDVLEPLLQLTLRLQTGQTLQPRPEFRQAAAARMQNLIAARPRPQTSVKASRADQSARQRPGPWWQRLTRTRQVALVFSLILCLCLMFGSVTVHAANDAVPGQTLYPVKLAVENTRLVLSLDAVEQAKLRLSFAARRLDETAVLLASGSSSTIQQPLEAYQAEIEAVRAALEETSALTAAQKQTLAQLLITNLEQYDKQLTAFIDQVPADTQARFQLALEVSRLTYDQALIITGESDGAIMMPTATATSTPLPATSTAKPTVAMETAVPPTATPTATATPTPLPQKAIIPTISPDCLPPPSQLEPEAWKAWLENCAVTTDLPPNWLDLLKNWPTPPPFLTPPFPTPPAPDVWQTPLPLPSICGTPPDNLDPDAWRAWLEQCNIPADQLPSGWPELPPTGDWVTSPDQLPPPPEGWNPPEDLPPSPDNWPGDWGG